MTPAELRHRRATVVGPGVFNAGSNALSVAQAAGLTNVSCWLQTTAWAKARRSRKRLRPLSRGRPSVFVVPWVPYLQSPRLEKDATIPGPGHFVYRGDNGPCRTFAIDAPGRMVVGVNGVALCGAVGGAFASPKVGEALRDQLNAQVFPKALFLSLQHLARRTWCGSR